MRRLHFVKGLSQREICRRTGLHRDTIRKAVNSNQPPVHRRAAGGGLSGSVPLPSSLGACLATP
jgi:hypothetical protein